MRRFIGATFAVAGLLAMMVPAASAKGLDQTTLENAGWVCGEAAGLPPGHCVNPAGGTLSNGGTSNVMVFHDGQFETSETLTLDLTGKADSRPCPNDPESPDGTWWNPGDPTPPILYVCHHSGH